MQKEYRNRKRGKGKIKLTKRQKVDNEELASELISFKESLKKERNKKFNELAEIQENIKEAQTELARLNTLKRQPKQKMEELSNKIKTLERQFIDTKKRECRGNASERLGELFLDLVENYATSSKFSRYTYLEEMKSKAIFFLLKYSHSYDPVKSPYAFAYCTMITHRAFLQVIKKENKRAESNKKFNEEQYRNSNFFKKEDPLLFGM